MVAPDVVGVPGATLALGGALRCDSTQCTEPGPAIASGDGVRGYISLTDEEKCAPP